MAESARATLRQLLQLSYDDLKRRLARRLGSTELAGEALQDTFLRLERAETIGPVRNPRGYLFRMAINLAINRRHAEARRLAAPETTALLELADDAPGPARIAEARSEVAALKRAIGALPARRRAIFLAAWREELAHPAIAERFGVSLRTVQVELRHALEHCAAQLDRDK
jgi:RNA polymerase sigma-70 factor (ECF subfamily)